MDNDQNYIFKETQTFMPQGLFLLVIILISGSLIYLELVKKVVIEENLWKNLYFHITAFGLLFLFYKLKLETKISPQAIDVKFLPFHHKFKEIKFSELKNFEVRKYRPFVKYGGWEFKWGYKSGKAYNISGNKGL